MKLIELLAFAVSVVAFCGGGVTLFKKGVPRYFQLYVCAAGCYMLEELWSIVNVLFGKPGQGGLLTVGLIGFFGCLCFMLSACVNGFDKVTDEGTDKKAKILALIAPAVLLLLYAVYVFSVIRTKPIGVIIVGLLSISPALFASYFNLKHLLLPRDDMGFLKAVKWIDVTALLFYAANYVYPLLNLTFTRTAISIYDLILAVMLFVIIVLCGRGAKQWKTLIF